MKFLYLAVSLLALCSCADESTEDIVEEPEEVYVPPLKKSVPPPPEPEPSEPAPIPQCKIVAYWSNDCYVVKIYCKNKPPRIEVSCGPGRPLWPWEVDPYPPPYDNRK
jgi:hypothetical protein